MENSLFQFVSEKKYTKKKHSILFNIMLIWVLGYFLLSIAIYSRSNPFSIHEVWISSLGNPVLGNKCDPVFNIGVFLTMVFLIFHYLFMFRILPIKHIWTRLPLQFLFFLGALGFGGISIFTDNIQPIHDILAGFAFGGLGLGYLLLDLLYIRWAILKIRDLDAQNIVSIGGNSSGKEEKPPQNSSYRKAQGKNKTLSGKTSGFLILGTVIVVMVFLITSVGIFIYGGIDYRQNIDWIIVWEWLAFFALGLNIVAAKFLVNLL